MLFIPLFSAVLVHLVYAFNCPVIVLIANLHMQFCYYFVSLVQFFWLTSCMLINIWQKHNRNLFADNICQYLRSFEIGFEFETFRFEFYWKVTCWFENFESAAHAVCRHHKLEHSDSRFEIDSFCKKKSEFRFTIIEFCIMNNIFQCLWFICYLSIITVNKHNKHIAR